MFDLTDSQIIKQKVKESGNKGDEGKMMGSGTFLWARERGVHEK